ncbi:hypothetical protein L226DRAFT_233322 [Lentinus tigrinus ALCF2SS1-7]|uniref:uncharacterized protein n=1 Tax=Lentinus tigrinus ALCF2SS1-7 TaxID=1328758 RepID=UPI00116622E8|nr:hypothetical protein L226DRAFT_233322 [Lentinus tigrinus ALCF2SS1-7]
MTRGGRYSIQIVMVQTCFKSISDYCGVLRDLSANPFVMSFASAGLIIVFHILLRAEARGINGVIWTLIVHMPNTGAASEWCLQNWIGKQECTYYPPKQFQSLHDMHDIRGHRTGSVLVTLCRTLAFTTHRNEAPTVLEAGDKLGC